MFFISKPLEMRQKCCVTDFEEWTINFHGIHLIRIFSYLIPCQCDKYSAGSHVYDIMFIIRIFVHEVKMIFIKPEIVQNSAETKK